MSLLPLFRPVLQRAGWDCAVAALASLLGRSYEDVLVICARSVPKLTIQGMTTPQMRRAAAEMGVVLRVRKAHQIDREEHTGILGLLFPNGTVHAVVLAYGLIFDPQDRGCVWDADTYMQVYTATMLDLLEEGE